MAKARDLLRQRIRQLRKKGGLSQERFAELLGIDPNSVSRIECGIHDPSLDTLEKIAKVLKIEMRDLFLFNSKESAEELRTYLAQTASELDVEKLREVVRAVRKMV
jgi:putative transcriptional regulator